MPIFNPPVSGGGAEISDPNVGYVRTDGSDSTGDGSPGNPYATAQKAFDEGFRVFDFGVGNFGSIFINSGPGSGGLSLSYRGCGFEKTSLANIFLGPGSAISDLTVQDLPGLSVNVSGIISTTKENLPSVPLVVRDVYATSVSTAGSQGLEASEGHYAAPLYIEGACYIQDASSHGGDGGASNEGSPSGNGVSGSDINITGPTTIVASISAKAGEPGPDDFSMGQGNAGEVPGVIYLAMGCNAPAPTSGETINCTGATMNGLFYAQYP